MEHRRRQTRRCAQVFLAAALAVGLAAIVVVSAAADGPPAWAYGFTTPPPAPGAPAVAPAPASPATPAAPAAAPEDPPRQVPDSTVSFTLAQVRDPFGPADWFPGDHPVMPDVVAHGRRPGVRACGFCHYPNGKGRPENAPVAGLPPAYFIQTMSDFRNGLRKTADPRKANTETMSQFARGMTDEEIKAAAAYFGSMKWTPWITVREVAVVPKTRLVVGMFVREEGSASEPLGSRIIEAPENTEATELLRNPRSGFIAYAPIGSTKRGEALVTTGAGGKTTACATCHGAQLEGLGPVPGLAGRSPSYMVRQMYDMQQGTRAGMWSELMKPVVAKLTTDDMVAIAAYLASRRP